MPVVGESWLVESRASKRLVDPWLHLLKVIFSFLSFNFVIEPISLKEPAAEKKLGMRLEESVRLARNQPLLAGWLLIMFFSQFYI